MATVNWSSLNEQFYLLDKLCESLCKEYKIDLNNKRNSNQVTIDLSTYEDDNLFTYTVLLPNELRPLSYSNVTNELLNELSKDEWFKSEGTLLRTLEKGVLHPVLHYSTVPKNDKDDRLKLFKSNKFGSNHTLYQSVYKEVCCIELPLVSKNGSKNVSKMNENDNKLNVTITDKSKQHSIANEQDENCKLNSFDSSTTDYSIDSGCVSLNSTTNDYSNVDSNDYANDPFDDNSAESQLESLDSSYDSMDSMLNSVNSVKSIKSIVLNRTKKDEPIECTDKITDNNLDKLSKNIELYKNNLNTDKNLLNNLSNYNLNDGHLIIKFRINDEFFSDVFERNWQDMTGARFLTPIAAQYGLTKLTFLKRIAQNTENYDSTDIYSKFNYNYLLHAEFLNLTIKNEIYLSNFVHRLRLRSLGSVTFYTNLKAN